MFIRSDWKPYLLDDLVDNFRNIAPGERRTHEHGRVAHFSYRPREAPGRVFVRNATRGGIIGAFLGNLYTALDRPLRELRASSLARDRGVSVPEALAVRATRVGGLFWRFTVITREVEEASDLLSISASLPVGNKRELIERVADEMRRLHEAGVYHSDITLKNILLSGSSVYIIDLDKARLPGTRSAKHDIENLSRLNRSIEKLLGSKGLITRTDKLRFLRRYLGTRDRLREFSEQCAAGLWFHRLWWSMTGQSRPA